MTEYAGQGDARRTLALLWGTTEASTRGPKPGLDVETIVAAAIAVADAEGLGALSMRKVAERLGRSVMSLYTYVPGKAELLDVMLDRVQAESPRNYDRSAGWRPAVEAMARSALAFYERHPWVLQVSTSRTSMGPHEFDAYETALSLLDGIGLTGLQMQRAVGAIDAFVRGSAKNLADARAGEGATGMSDDEWWFARRALLDEMTADVWAERYPVSTRLDTEEHVFEQPERAPGDATGYMERDVIDAFDFGLQLLLDGIEALVGRD